MWIVLGRDYPWAQSRAMWMVSILLRCSMTRRRSSRRPPTPSIVVALACATFRTSRDLWAVHLQVAGTGRVARGTKVARSTGGTCKQRQTALILPNFYLITCCTGTTAKVYRHTTSPSWVIQCGLKLSATRNGCTGTANIAERSGHQASVTQTQQCANSTATRASAATHLTLTPSKISISPWIPSMRLS